MSVTFPKILDAWVQARKDGYQAAIDKQKADGTRLSALNEKIDQGFAKLGRNRARWEEAGKIEDTYNTLVAKASRAFDRFEHFKTMNTGLVLNGLDAHEIAIILEFHNAARNENMPQAAAELAQQQQSQITDTLSARMA